jgi:hypothetical protein
LENNRLAIIRVLQLPPNARRTTTEATRSGGVLGNLYRSV